MATSGTPDFEITEEDNQLLSSYGFKINYEEGIYAVLGCGLFGRVLKGTCLDYAMKKVFDGNRSTEVSLKGKTCAIKQLNKKVYNESKWKDAKYTEAKMLMDMNHPNLVSVYAVVETPRNTFFVMEYFNGPNLKEYISRNRISSETAIDILRQLVTGIEYLHKSGIVHGDLQDTNIMLLLENKQVHVKIIDLGRARKLENENQMIDIRSLGKNLEKLVSSATFTDHNLQKSLQVLAQTLRYDKIYTDINQVIEQLKRILPEPSLQPSQSSLISKLLKRKSNP